MEKEIKTNPELWEKINSFSLDNPEASFNFTARLARENGWSIDFSKKVVLEYKKFIYLSVISGRPLTPSDEVDQAWHLHLIYSYSYWVEFCKNTLGGFNLHHGPTKGGRSEGEKYSRQYQYTLDLYKEVFGVKPPSDVWPNEKTRFSKVVFKRVSMHDNYVLNKKKVKEYLTFYIMLPIVTFLAGMLMSADSIKKNDTDISTTTLVVIGILIFIFIIRGIIRYSNRKSRGGSSSSSSSSSSSDSGCSIMGSFFGCGSDSSSGCGSSGCGSSGCSGCGGCGGD